MVVNANPIRFPDDDARPLHQHLSRWATHALGTPEQWAQTIEATGWWTDLSARNQVLLASYQTVTGPVAGPAGWAAALSTDPDRSPTPKAGEHGYLIRVPVTTTGTAPVTDRSRHGAMTATALTGMRWEPVFTAAQLTPRPQPRQLQPAPVPAETATVDGFTTAVRTTVLRIEGRAPKNLPAPMRRLEVAAQRVPPTPRSPALHAELYRQAAWVVADRVGYQAGPMPTFDPRPVPARDRWQLLVATRHVTGRLLVAMGHAVGVDLAATGLPKVISGPDTDVKPGRANVLSRAERANLPDGQWTEIGPYRRDEWARRGIHDAEGRGAFYGLNGGRYLAVYETTSGARWRLETVTGNVRTGIINEGTANSFDNARRYGLDHIRRTHPTMISTVSVTSKLTVLTPTPTWQPLPGARDTRTIARALDDQVRLVVAPGPGGRWQSWLQNGTDLTPLALSRSRERAQTDAERAGWAARVDNTARNPAGREQLVADAAGTPAWSRDLLVAAIGNQLDPDQRQQLTDPNLDARTVGELCAIAGLNPDTIIAVLCGERHPPDQITAIAIEHGAHPVPTMRQLHTTYQLDIATTGALLGATADQLRAAGATPRDILRAAPRDVLRQLDTRPETWAATAAALVTSGHDPHSAATHLLRMAPTPTALAAGLGELFDTLDDALDIIGTRLDPNELAALTNHLSTGPGDTEPATTTPTTTLSGSGTTLEHTVARLVAELPDLTTDPTNPAGVDPTGVDIDRPGM